MAQRQMKKAICLLSGGLDSTTALFVACQRGYRVTCLTVSYGQIHEREIKSARQIAAGLRLKHYLIPIVLPWGGSALLDPSIPIPLGREESEMKAEIPSTYVSARNSIFLSFAASCAEAEGAEGIFIGANALDYSGYPDCRPEYFDAFQEMLRRGTRAGVEGLSLRIEAPLLRMTKKEIVILGQRLGVPFKKTWSCYQGEAMPCRECDACRLRAKGFQEAGFEDPLIRHAISALR